MNEEEERTELMKTMLIEQEVNEDDEMSILELIEEFEEKLDYLDLDKTKKKKLGQMCEEIKKEEDDKVREYLFDLLQKEMD